MKKISVCLAISLCVLHTQAQQYEKISEKFIQFYNAQKPDSLFILYNPVLQEKLPLEKTKAVLSGLHVQYGDLKSLSLLKQDSGFNMYKAGFAHQTLTLLLSLDSENLIEGYRLVPYSPDQFPEEKIKRK
jgi:uncharacterized protein